MDEYSKTMQALLAEAQRRQAANEPLKIEVWRQRWTAVGVSDRIIELELLDEGWWPSSLVTLNNPHETGLVYVRGGANMPQIPTRLVPPL